MVSIILAANDETKRAAKALGFTEQTVLIKHDGCLSTAEEKARLEHELFEIKPYQFLVSDFWGACNPD